MYCMNTIVGYFHLHPRAMDFCEVSLHLPMAARVFTRKPLCESLSPVSENGSDSSNFIGRFDCSYLPFWDQFLRSRKYYWAKYRGHSFLSRVSYLRSEHTGCDSRASEPYQAPTIGFGRHLALLHQQYNLSLGYTPVV